jgi:hypothetical protein
VTSVVAQSPLKNFGDASLHPRMFRLAVQEEAYLFFLAFFFAGILFSSRRIHFFSASDGWRSALSV